MAPTPFVIAWTWVVVIVLALAPLGVQRAAALEGAAEIKQYTTAAVEEDRVLDQTLPQASPEAPEAKRRATKALQEDIKALYPIGTPAAATFMQAQWVLAEDGTAALLLPPPRPAGEEFNLVGTWGQRGGAYRLHLAGGSARRGLAATLDGLLQPSGDSYHLDGVFTVTLRGARHGERLVLRLMPAVNPYRPSEPMRSWSWHARAGRWNSRKPKSAC
jgi:hypothetical protein